MGTIYTLDTRKQGLDTRQQVLTLDTHKQQVIKEYPYPLKPKQTENSIVGEFLDVIKESNGFVAVGHDFLGRGIFVRLNNLLPRYPIWGLS